MIARAPRAKGRRGGELKAVEGSSLSGLSRWLACGRGRGRGKPQHRHRRHRVIAELSLTGRSIDYYFYAPRPRLDPLVCARARRPRALSDLIIKASHLRDTDATASSKLTLSRDDEFFICRGKIPTNRSCRRLDKFCEFSGLFSVVQ